MKNIKKFSSKIVSLDILQKKIGKFPRKKKAILCHGVFDIVHPGHIRHLVFAKSKADVLIVSITADRHIKKGTYRPHVPENLRALNLSLFEIVDYVLIDQNPTPIKNIKLIKPDFYAKGYEYSKTKNSSATQEEIETLKKIGSRMIFTPGDIVYSSSKLLNQNLPDLKYEKLNQLINQKKIDLNQVDQILDEIKNIKVHVIGDMIIDTYTQGKSIGGQTKTPTLSIKVVEETNYIGGAGIVAKHLRQAGADVFLTTVIGHDKLGNFSKRELIRAGIKCCTIRDDSRPTVNKNVIIAENHRLIKLDKVENHPISDHILKEVLISVKKVKADIIIFSDFRHGIFNESSINQIIKLAPKNSFKVADSQVASRWGNITDFKNLDLITPNEREARFSVGEQDASVQGLADLVKSKSKVKNLILKLGEKGVLCSDGKNSFFSMDSFVEHLLDPVGSGDALLSYASLVYFKTKSLFLASLIGSIAAACECEVNGNVPISKKIIKLKLQDIKNKIKFQQ